MEFVAGIPGTLGGALAMNAGTRIGEMKDVVRRVELATADGAGFLDARELGFAYRTSRLPPGAVATRIEFALRPGDVAESERVMQEDRERRRRTQPLDRPSFGSTFRNPPGEYAGRLVEAVGLKGHRIGGAMWSDVHANFVVNLGGARASDVLGLVNLARYAGEGAIRDRARDRGPAPRRVPCRRDARTYDLSGGNPLKWTGKKVAVLYGGRSTERDVSLRTGKACADALVSKGYDVALVDVDQDLPERLREVRRSTSRSTRCTAAGARTAASRGSSRSMGIPYTGSGVLASAMGMDKVVAKAIFKALGLAGDRLPRLPRGECRAEIAAVGPAVRAPVRREALRRGLLGRRPHREGPDEAPGRLP